MDEKMKLPIIYLRGYAGTQGGVEATVDDPFYGFNTGSTHVRVGSKKEAFFFVFESPVVRLMTDYQYQDVYLDGREPMEGDVRLVPRKSFWIYRYYDETSRTFSDSPGRRLEIEEAAESLRRYIDRVKQQTKAEKVILVGHSTGGLIIRSLLQKKYPEAGAKAVDHVDKVFTYATPHGGIHFDKWGGIIEWARDQLGWNNMDDFGQDRMYQYLTPHVKPGTRAPDNFDPKSLGDAFPPKRFFCLVGTNAPDYGVPKHVVGPRSDGLVQIDHAYVREAPRAYVHRAHSGRYGVVNSEEGYQNLRRFLFGNMRVMVFLDDLDYVALSPSESGMFHHADAQVAVRGLPVLMHDQLVAHHSAIPLEWEKEREGEPISLFEVFLIQEEAPEKQTCRYSINLAIHPLEERRGLPVFERHLEQTPLWTDTMIVDVVQTTQGYAGRYGWASLLEARNQDPVDDLEIQPVEGNVEARVPMPPRGRAVLGPRAVILLRTETWNTP